MTVELGEVTFNQTGKIEHWEVSHGDIRILVQADLINGKLTLQKPQGAPGKGGRFDYHFENSDLKTVYSISRCMAVAAMRLEEAMKK